jgi:predicted MPP superfamily phosphohydrolase
VNRTTPEVPALLLPEAEAAVPPRLPWAANRFDGFTVLHLSDLHLDGMPGLEEIILERVGATEFDLHRGMVGITNAGAGTSGVPVRFHTLSEILILTLRGNGAGSRPHPAPPR